MNSWPWVNPYMEEVKPVPILREAFSDWKTGEGIFDIIASIGEVQWTEQVESTVLDFEYFGNRSGGKFVSPVVLHLLGENESLTMDDREMLAKIILAKFTEPWNRLWETNVVAYNPIHNYNMTEHRQLEREDTGSQSDSAESSETTTHGKHNEVIDYVYGYNSDDAYGKQSDRSTSQDSGVTQVADESSLSRDTDGTRSEEETTTRSGNIGVTTTQELLKAERDLWKWNFFEQVYKDIDTVLSIPFYDPCRV